jgi:hypothetical protein
MTGSYYGSFLPLYVGLSVTIAAELLHNNAGLLEGFQENLLSLGPCSFYEGHTTGAKYRYEDLDFLLFSCFFIDDVKLFPSIINKKFIPALCSICMEGFTFYTIPCNDDKNGNIGSLKDIYLCILPIKDNG